MKNLKEMTAKEESGLTVKEIAERLGVRASVIKRYLKEDDLYWPSLEKLPLLCAGLGNNLLLDWAAAQSDRKAESPKDIMLLPLSRAMEVLEELRLLVDKTETLTCWEEKGIDAALDEVAFECGRIRAFLPQRGGGGCGGRKRFWCPLGKFWRKCFSKSRRRER